LDKRAISADYDEIFSSFILQISIEI